MTKKQQRFVRKLARATVDCTGMPYPIRVVEKSSEKPRLVGESYYWTTPSGLTRVRHPNAYGWRTLYHPSTHTITVGEYWLQAALVLKPDCPPEIVEDFAKEIIQRIQ